MRQRFLLGCAVIAALVLFLLLTQGVHAAPLQQATDTPAPTQTATPAYVTTYVLESGNTLQVDRRWTFGERAIFDALIVLIGLQTLEFIYEVARQWER